MSNQEQATSSKSKLSHLSYSFTGYTDTGKRWEVERKTFEELFGTDHVIVIPLFQRRYCWGTAQIQEWWKDTSGFHGSRGNDPVIGGHGTGKCIFKYSTAGARPSSGRPQLVCVDGQQRATTMQMMLVSARDAALGLLQSGEIRSLSEPCSSGDREQALLQVEIDKIGTYLFRDLKVVYDWAKTWALKVLNQLCSRGNLNSDLVMEIVRKIWLDTHPIGAEPPFDPVLLPSYHDRSPFYQLLTHGLCSHELKAALRCQNALSDDISQVVIDALSTAMHNATNKSQQAAAKTYFDSAIQQELTQRCHNSSHSKEARGVGNPSTVIHRYPRLELLSMMRGNALEKVSIMYCEILQDVSLPQLFLWIQEKTLFGMGALLFNPTPGIHFAAIDLVRNFLFAPTVSLDMAEQEKLYQQCWALPLEGQFQDNSIPDLFIVEFLQHYVGTQNNTEAHTSHLEKQLALMLRTMPSVLTSKLNENQGITLYARFLSYVESLQLEQGGVGVEDGDETPTVSPETARKVMEQMAEFCRKTDCRVFAMPHTNFHGRKPRRIQSSPSELTESDTD